MFGVEVVITSSDVTEGVLTIPVFCSVAIGIIVGFVIEPSIHICSAEGVRLV